MRPRSVSCNRKRIASRVINFVRVRYDLTTKVDELTDRRYEGCSSDWVHFSPVREGMPDAQVGIQRGALISSFLTAT
jgi:hypothetical protein